jgi:hypothetical protein
LIITAGLVFGNFVLFTPWRTDQDPRNRHAPSPQSKLVQANFHG